MVTAEFAVLLPVVVMVLGLVLAMGSVGLAELRCLDAARSAARLAARHEPGGVVLASARAAAPEGARISVTADGADRVRVQVAAGVRLPLPGRPRIAVGEVAVARLEPLDP